MLDKTYPGQYGFAALRCAIDNLNGDNVEWIGYPSGASHVFCYAYYVKPPPTSGTIVITKAVSSPAGATHTFSFGGNVSFNADGTFDLAVQNGSPASMTFYRAETGQNDQPWSVQELVPPGWFLSSLACTSHTGKSTTTTSVETATATITLAPGDTVTCTYTDSETPPPSALTLTKTTIGGVGKLRLHGHTGGGRSVEERDRHDDQTRCGGRGDAREDRAPRGAVQDRRVAADREAVEPGRSRRSRATARSFPLSARSR